MPMLDLKLPAGAVAPDALPGLLADLTTVLLRARGLPDTPASRAGVWAFTTEHAGAPGTVVTASVVAGRMSDDGARGFIADATRLVVTATGGDPEAPGDRERVWVVVREVPRAHWGVGGRLT
jgi:phenylpyruvate tautomerase PptA (4-oxalocrotonate tautomerase family)